MVDTRRFSPTWRVSIRWGLTAATAVSLVAIVSSLRGPPPSATQWALLLLLLIFATVAFTLMRRFPAVKVAAEGVFAARGSGLRSRLVRWHEIAQVIPTSMYGLRFLVLVTGNPFPEQLRMLMHLDDVSALRDFVATRAGTQHPLTIWLSEAQLLSDRPAASSREP